MDCLFCKIVSGAIPNHTVYEDDNVLAFLDIHPCATGHTVVVPKIHFGRLSEMSPKDWGRVMGGVQKTLERVYSILKPTGVNVAINDGESAGQAVPHVHWHILPRKTGDGGGSAHSIVRVKDTGDVKEIAKLFV